LKPAKKVKVRPLSDKKCFNKIAKKYQSYASVNQALIKKLKYPIVTKFFFTYYEEDVFPLPDMEFLYRINSKFTLLKFNYEKKNLCYSANFLQEENLSALFSDYYSFNDEENKRVLICGLLIIDWRVFFSNLRLNCYKEYRFSSLNLEVYSIFETPIAKLIKIKEMHEKIKVYTNMEKKILTTMSELGKLYKEMRKYYKTLKKGEEN